jgi:transketolase
MKTRVEAFLQALKQEDHAVEAVMLYQNGEILLNHRFIPHCSRLIYSHTKSFVSTAAGMALGLKTQGSDARVYTLLGDGEIQEGQVWEAAMFAAHYKLDNMVVIVDNNGLQIDGNIADVMSPYPIVDKFLAFGFNTIAIDGHDFDAIEKAFEAARKCKGQPTAIVMSTTKGKGVSYMENNAGWHGKAPNDAEFEQAMAELNAAMAELEGK